MRKVKDGWRAGGGEVQVVGREKGTGRGKGNRSLKWRREMDEVGG